MAELSSKVAEKLPELASAEPDKRAYSFEGKGHARNARARASQSVETGPNFEGGRKKDRSPGRRQTRKKLIDVRRR